MSLINIETYSPVGPAWQHLLERNVLDLDQTHD